MAFDPDIKFIMTLRDPVLWLNSLGAFKTDHRVDYEFADRFMCVADAVETWLKAFPRESFLFLDSAKMFADLNKTMESVFKHVGVEMEHINTKFDAVEHTILGAGRRRAARWFDEHFQKVYHATEEHRQCKKRLEELTGLTFDWGEVHG